MLGSWALMNIVRSIVEDDERNMIVEGAIANELDKMI
jgi:hypothetical protein